MIIIRETYTLKRENWVYFLTARITGDLTYSLNVMRNGSPTTVQSGVISPNVATKLDVTDTEIYQLQVTVGTDLYDLIDIRGFNELKQDIITTMQDAICDCEGVDCNTCTTYKGTPTQINLNNLQLLYNSVLDYRNLLLSKTFLRPIDGAAIDVFSSMSVELLSALHGTYGIVNAQGAPETTVALLRKQTAIMYIILFAIEYDIATFTDYIGETTPGVPLPYFGDDTSPVDEVVIWEELEDEEDEDIPIIDQSHSQEVKDLYTWFGISHTGNFEVLIKCFSEACIDPAKVFKTFYDNYVHCDIDVDLCSDPNDPKPEDDIISNLMYDNYVSPLANGTAFVVTTFTWDSTGTPKNLLLSDNVGIITDLQVSGNTHTLGTSVTYQMNSLQKIVWTLNGSNVSAIALTTIWTSVAYWGRSDNPINITLNSDQIKAGTDMFTQGSTSFKFNPNITSNQFAWAAVPANTQAVYRKWLVADGGGSGVPNSGLIGDVSSGGNTGEAWKRMRDAIVDGQQYYFYAMNFPAQINSNVTLSA